MCGIAGACWTAGGKPLADDELRRMVDVLTHRGPDDSGFYWSTRPNGSPHGDRAAGDLRSTSASGGAALGFRRLSIIDLAGGHQPLSNEDGTIWIVFNGEIFNYRELRPDLEAKGHQFKTASDTETIVHLYEEYGTDCVSHLRGQFAFAIWDNTRRRLFLARDRLGQKPLFYRQDGERLLFASELKSLLQVSGAPRELNPTALDEFLCYQYVPHPDSILRGYHKLPPAHWALFADGKLQVRRYWRPPYDGIEIDPSASNGARLPTSEREWKQALRETLTEAVRLRMRSDVPLGAFLSGGIDSTIIVGLMQQLSSRPVHTFSIGFPVAQFDERRYAREAAQLLKTEHHEAVVTPDAVNILPKLVWHYDEPFADSSAIPMMYLCEMTRRNVTVALSGDGGDEMFGGYDRYRAVRVAAQIDRLPYPLKSMLTAKVWQSIPASVRQQSWRRRLKRLLIALGEKPEARYLRWINIFDPQLRQELYSDDFRTELKGADATQFLLDAYADCGTRDFVTRTTCADVLTYLPCDILTKVDIASMAYSLEARSPFLDHRVAELAARMPLELKLKGNRGKRVLVETFSEFLPQSIQQRRKMGFGVPIDHWFRNELKPMLRETLLDRRSLERGYFNESVVRRLIDEHTSASWDHSYRLWSLLVFELWQRMYLDVPAPPAVCPVSV